MNHSQFILIAYLISTAALLWATIAPVVSKRRLMKQLKAAQRRKG